MNAQRRKTQRRKPASTIAFLPETGFIREPTVLAHVGAGRTTVRNWIKEGHFPAPVKLSTRMVAWRAEDLRRWIQQRAAA